MPRNDQVTRQWYLLRELESGKGLTLQEMRQRLPEEIQRHDRTLRRDIEALEAAGFPITTNSINGQTRWKLIEGFHQVPALSFSPTELMSLAFSRNLLKPLVRDSNSSLSQLGPEQGRCCLAASRGRLCP